MVIKTQDIVFGNEVYSNVAVLFFIALLLKG